MHVTDKMIDQMVTEILATAKRDAAARPDAASSIASVPIGVSNRHIHLSRTDMDTLFGPGANLTRKKSMKQPGHFAAEECVTLKGPKGEFAKVRILGPFRKETQIEISVADGFVLGVKAPMRMSGDLEGSAGIEVIGPHGSVNLETGVIIAQRHIHMSPQDARDLGLANGDTVCVEVSGARGGVMENVAIRAAEGTVLEMHIDIEEANAFGLGNNDNVRILKR